MLYSRLYLFKGLTKEMADRSNDPFEPNPSSIRSTIQADLAKLGNRLNQSFHYYDLMLESCEKLFDNELEQPAFEEMMRYMFGLKACLMFSLPAGFSLTRSYSAHSSSLPWTSSLAHSSNRYKPSCRMQGARICTSFCAANARSLRLQPKTSSTAVGIRSEFLGLTRTCSVSTG